MNHARIATARALCARYAQQATAALRAATVPSVAIVSDGDMTLFDLPHGTEGMVTLPIDLAERTLFAYGPGGGELSKPPPDGYGHLVVFVEGRPGFFNVLVQGEPTSPGSARVGSA